MRSAHDHTAPVRFPILQGVLPITAARIPAEILAGITLAAIAVPEVMGYTKISGTPVITGLYTMLIPTALFAVFGSSRHLVVGADSATAAILASALVGMAATGSDQYLALAGVLALMAAGFLILARLMRLGFLADFLSRTRATMRVSARIPTWSVWPWPILAPVSPAPSSLTAAQRRLKSSTEPAAEVNSRSW
jgi:SulP family sulfate permease